MPATKESINSELFNTLKSRGYEPYARDTVDKKASVSDADLFVFKFVKNGQQYGPARVSIDEKNNLVLYTNDRLEDSPSSPSKNSDFDDSWTGLKRYLRKWSRRHGLSGFKLVRDGYLQSDMETRKDMKNKKLNEGYHAMGKKLTYSDSIPSVKILIQHTRQIEEGEQRYRNINRIFVENTNGERFLLPTKRPGIAKVYARHIAEGGTPYDERGKHITSLVEEYTKMAGFVRATKNGQFNESTQRLVNEGVNHYQNLRETLSSMISMRGYNKYFDNYTPVLNEETDDATTLNELFVEETIDPRIESVMPILKRLSKNLNEMSEVKALEEWAESITEVEDETTKTLAEPASDMLDEADIEEGKLAKAALLGLAGISALNPLAAKAGGVSLPGSGGEFSADQQVQLNKSTEAQMNAIQDLQKFLAKMGMRQVISGELDNVTYDNIMKASQMHDAGKMSGDQADMFKDLSTKAGLMKEGKLDEIGMASLKSGEYLATKRIKDFKKEIERLKASGETQNIAKYEKAIQHYEDLVKKMQGYPAKMQTKNTAKKLGAMMPAKMRNVAEAPGAETLAHNDDTEEKNLKAFGLAEGFVDVEEIADEVMQSMGSAGKLTTNDIRDAVIDLQQNMDDPYKLDVEAVVDTVKDRLAQKGMNIADTNEGLDANQKAAGQLGPTEKVGKNEKNLRGKLVGASESVENDELNRIKEMIGYK